MKKTNLLWFLTVAMMMGGCVRYDKDNNNQKKTSGTDTVKVIGVWDNPVSPTKDVKCVSKDGRELDIFIMHASEYSKAYNDAKYIERGDTVVIKDGKIINNLTMENMAKRYVNGR